MKEDMLITLSSLLRPPGELQQIMETLKDQAVESSRLRMIRGTVQRALTVEPTVADLIAS